VRFFAVEEEMERFDFWFVKNEGGKTIYLHIGESF